MQNETSMGDGGGFTTVGGDNPRGRGGRGGRGRGRGGRRSRGRARSSAPYTREQPQDNITGEETMGDVGGSSSRGGSEGRYSRLREGKNRQQNQTLPKSQIIEYAANNFDSTTKVLNLSNLSTALNMQQPINFNDVRIAKTLFTFVSLKVKGVVAMDLSANGISSLSGLSNLSIKFPQLQLLNLEKNSISNLSELDHLSRCKNLKQISLLGNPIQAEASQNREDYISKVTQKLPQLEAIDGQEIVAISFPAIHRQITLPDPSPTFCDSSVAKLAQEFVQRFFNVFDGDRKLLQTAYDEKANLSYTLGTDQFYLQEQNHQQSLAALNEMGANSRNLQQVVEPKKRKELLLSSIHGIIYYLLEKFPKTQHDLSQCVVDCHVAKMPVGSTWKDLILLSIHAYVTIEGHKRTFDRTFILDRATPAGQQQGWNLRIINDQLHIRPFYSLDINALKPGQQQQQQQQQQGSASGSPTAATTVAPQQMPQQNQQQLAVQQLSNETEMTQAFALKCLQDSNWDYGTALKNFNLVKARLPREAFL